MTFDLIGTDGNCHACGVDFVPVDAPWGAEGRYLLKRYLGGGGMGIVFAARDTALGATWRSRFPTSTFAIAGGTRSSSDSRPRSGRSSGSITLIFAAFYESAKWDDHLYYTMRFLEGGTLADRIKDAGPLDCDAAARWVLTVAQAMDYAHGMGVVHRDLKPANLMFDGDEQAVRDRLRAGALHRRPRGNATHPRRRSAWLAGLHGARASSRNVGLARAPRATSIPWA